MFFVDRIWVTCEILFFILWIILIFGEFLYSLPMYVYRWHDIPVLIFLAHLAKDNVNFCHHLVSVVCYPLTFHILIFSSETPRPNELETW